MSAVRKFVARNRGAVVLRAVISGAAAGALFVQAPLAASPTVTAAQVFERLASLSLPAEREAYLASSGGTAVNGQGWVEAVLPRTYYDTSVPDANPTVALIELGHGRKIACGLSYVPSREEFHRLSEGVAIGFRGALVDAQAWDAWTTLYLGNCSLSPR